MNNMKNLNTLVVSLGYLDDYAFGSNEKELAFPNVETLRITDDWNRPRMRLKCLKFPRLKHLVIPTDNWFCQTWFCQSLETLTLGVVTRLNDEVVLGVLHYYDNSDLGPQFRMKNLRKLTVTGLPSTRYSQMDYSDHTLEQLTLFLVEHPSVSCIDLQGCIFEPRELIEKVTAPFAARKILFIFRLCKQLILGDVNDKLAEWMEGQDPKYPLIQIQLDGSMKIC
jgi:hypothetical protein